MVKASATGRRYRYATERRIEMSFVAKLSFSVQRHGFGYHKRSKSLADNLQREKKVFQRGHMGQEIEMLEHLSYALASATHKRVPEHSHDHHEFSGVDTRHLSQNREQQPISHAHEDERTQAIFQDSTQLSAWIVNLHIRTRGHEKA